MTISMVKEVQEQKQRLKEMRRGLVRVTGATIVSANTAAQTATVQLPDGTIIQNVPVMGNYIPEAGHSVQIVNNGTSPVVHAPSQPITSAAPAQVTGVTVTPGMGSLVVRWAALTEADIKWNRGYYQVQVDTVNTFNSGNLKSVDSPGTVSVITDLTAGTTYFVRVRGVDYVGQTGSYSTTASAAPNKVDGSADIVANSIVAGTIATNAVTANELAALSLEVGKFIRSTTYVAGSAGWAIAADGSAEFSNVTVRGTVDASVVKGSTMTGIIGANLVTNPGAETNTTGWTATNNTLTRDTVVKRTGTASFKLAATAGGEMSINTPTGTSGFPVIPGLAYSVNAFFKSAVTRRLARLDLRIYDATGALILTYSASYDDVTNFWRGLQVSSSGPMPSNARFASVLLAIQGAAAAEVHNIDDISLFASSSIYTDISTGPAGSPRVSVYSDIVPQVLLYSGVDGEAAGQLWRNTGYNGQAIDYSSMNLYSGYPPGGAASYIGVVSSGVSTGNGRYVALFTDSAVLNDGGGLDVVLGVHEENTAAIGISNSTTSTLPVEPTNTVRCTLKKRSAASHIIVRIGVSGITCSSGLGTTAKLYVWDGSTAYEVCRMPLGNGNPASGLHGMIDILYAAAPTTYTFQFRWLSSSGETINTDANGSYYLSVMEVSP